jgi:DNA repair exonuclease SbcCD ATPase subunit
MKYHGVRMAEVNHSIREKWQEIYKGGDIDYIEIKSEVEEEKDRDDDKPVTRGRSYAYRVMMIKGETEMDMRGRCSAGQKVCVPLWLSPFSLLLVSLLLLLPARSLPPSAVPRISRDPARAG